MREEQHGVKSQWQQGEKIRYPIYASCMLLTACHPYDGKYAIYSQHAACKVRIEQQNPSQSCIYPCMPAGMEAMEVAGWIIIEILGHC
jgi:hypothetical protein